MKADINDHVLLKNMTTAKVIGPAELETWDENGNIRHIPLTKKNPIIEILEKGGD